jgi:FixJ family two-component response regulator
VYSRRSCGSSGFQPAQIADPEKLKTVASSKQNAFEVDYSRFWLTGRETQVLRHVAFGLNNQEVVDALEISIEDQEVRIV